MSKDESMLCDVCESWKPDQELKFVKAGENSFYICKSCQVEATKDFKGFGGL